jgi:hypothetical protein
MCVVIFLKESRACASWGQFLNDVEEMAREGGGFRAVVGHFPELH